MASLAYRGHFAFMTLGNLVYIMVTRALWSSIYRGKALINGMAFEEAFLYLVLAMSVFLLFQTWTEWDMAGRIRTGDIVMDFLKPMGHQLQCLASVLGNVVVNLAAITLPSILIAVFVFRAPLPLGWNLLLFLPSLALAFLISFALDYMVGLTAFRTESVWGISVTKEMLVLFLSGALIPLPFFPEGLRRALSWLPFRYVYDAPIAILLGKAGTIEALRLIGVQAAWAAAVLLLSRAALARASRILTVNGG